MPVTIGSNISALRVQRRLADATGSLATSFERLSSGQRINKASDDAAGLSIATTLHANTRIYTQAVRNGNDGLSFLAIADGAIENLTGILTRITELASQSANGVYSRLQRRSIDIEAQSLAKEYLRIAKSTEFNGTRLFDGSFGSGARMQLGIGLDGSLNTSVGGALGTGSFRGRVSQQAGSGPYSVALADLNGDGIADMVTADSGSNAVSVSMGNGDGTFGARTTLAAGTSPRSVVLGDVNGDGVLDIVTADTGSASASIMLGNGDGTFKARTSVQTGSGPRAVTLGDINGDGVLDMVTADGTDATVSILLGNGDGTFRARTTMQTGTNPYSVALGDLNGDGRLDIVTSDFGNSTASIMLGNGDGTFRSRTNVTTGSSPNSVQLGDMNGDGVLDIVTADTGSSTVSILIGNGDGTFRTRNSLQVGTNPQSVALGDLNGDGALDIVTTDLVGGSASIIIGNGDGSFRARTSVATGTGPLGLALGDLNGDGVLDIVSADYGSGFTSAFLAQTQSGVGALLDFSLKTRADSLQALGMLRNASDNLAKQRGVIGSFQSRLGVTIGNLQASTENFRAAESRIIDADVAAESANLTRLQILQQAGAAVLAQASQSPALAIRLLQ